MLVLESKVDEEILLDPYGIRLWAKKPNCRICLILPDDVNAIRQPRGAPVTRPAAMTAETLRALLARPRPIFIQDLRHGSFSSTTSLDAKDLRTLLRAGLSAIHAAGPSLEMEFRI